MSGDYQLEATIYKKFTTRAFATGIPTVLAGTPVLSVYEDDNLTQITAGVTLTVDLDSVVGLNLATIVATAANGYEVGKDYAIVVTTGTVGGVSVVGEVICNFSINKSGSDHIVDDVWDEPLTGATHNIATSAGRRLRGLQDFGLYEGGAVWIDTINGTAGTIDFENGTVTNPVDSIADALTIRTSIGLPALHLIPGSAITLASPVDNIEFRGDGYTVALGGQSISGAAFYNALQITGNDDGSNTTKATFQNCVMNSSTLGLHKLRWCGLGGTITLAEAGTYDWIDCHSQVAGSSTPSVDTGVAVTNVNLNVRDYSGGLEVQNLGQAGTDTMSFEGDGHLVVNANCQNTNISPKGSIEVTDNGTAMTFSDNAAFSWTRAMTESYSTKNAAVTLEQALYELLSLDQEKAKVGVTITANQRDGSTPALTLTLGDATDPASITRAT